MSSVSVLVLRAAGINCDFESLHAFETAGADRVDHIHLNEFIGGRAILDRYDILVLSGGFSYGDDISGGKVLANELVYRLMDQIDTFVGKGKLILGICNGFQVLMKMGLLPQTSPGERSQEATVFYNDSGKFECRWVHLAINERSPCVFTQNMPDSIYVPVANAEGKVVTRSAKVLCDLQVGGHVALRYMDPTKTGGDSSDVAYPWSPNGSVAAIAGLCDTTGRIFGLMPHPERFIHRTQHPSWTRRPDALEPDGLYIFQNAVTYARGS
ncbi:MAG: phosphoribosylformylglycinamidine synthase subunit PurQ [Candidatus Latescibacteria bacterium]|jgi:phosphoribosylformylglycinamidine synthase subunit PurQ / glutaminase|nr:phosphoribosylformylglycinamidine synthase subunit PurQ [Candidatus Latescibacterota bacterium]